MSEGPATEPSSSSSTSAGPAAKPGDRRTNEQTVAETNDGRSADVLNKTGAEGPPEVTGPAGPDHAQERGGRGTSDAADATRPPGSHKGAPGDDDAPPLADASATALSGTPPAVGVAKRSSEANGPSDAPVSDDHLGEPGGRRTSDAADTTLPPGSHKRAPGDDVPPPSTDAPATAFSGTPSVGVAKRASEAEGRAEQQPAEMTENDFEQAVEPPREALLPYLTGLLKRRFSEVFEVEDPGGERATLGLRVLCAFMLSGLAGYFVEQRMGGGASMLVAPVAALFAAFACMLEGGHDRRSALVSIGWIIAAGTASAAAISLLSPVAERIGGIAPFLPVAAFLALWLRRFGATGNGAGIVLFLGAIYAVPFTFTLASLPWILLAGLIAMVSAALLRLQAGTSQADLSGLIRADVLRRMVARLLRDCRAALHEADGGALARAARRREALHAAWAGLRDSVDQDIAKDHPNRPRLDAALYRLYVLNQAATTAAEALAGLARDLPALDVKARATVSRLLLRLQRLAGEREPPAAALAAADEGIEALRTLAIGAAGLAPATRLDLLRLVFAATRIVRGIRRPLDLGAIAARTAPAAEGRGMLLTTRVAIQGGVATGLIVLLDLFLRQPHTYWAIVTAGVVMNTTLGDTWRRALQRGIGTAIGVMIGLVLGPLTGYAPWIMLPVFCLAIAVFAMEVKDRYDVASGAVGLAVVLGLEVFLQAPFSVLLSRIWETAFGSAVGILCAATVLPIRLSDQVRAAAIEMIGEAARTTRQAFARLEERDAAAVNYRRTGPHLLARWGSERARFRNLASEFIGRRPAALGGPLLIIAIDALIEQVVLLDDNASLLDNGLPEPMALLLRRIDERSSTAFAALLARLEGKGRPDLPGMTDLLPQLAEALPFAEAAGSDAQAQHNLVIQAQILYHARKIVELIGEIGHDLDQRQAMG